MPEKRHSAGWKPRHSRTHCHCCHGAAASVEKADDPLHGGRNDRVYAAGAARVLNWRHSAEGGGEGPSQTPKFPRPLPLKNMHVKRMPAPTLTPPWLSHGCVGAVKNVSFNKISQSLYGVGERLTTASQSLVSRINEFLRLRIAPTARGWDTQTVSAQSHFFSPCRKVPCP